MVHIIDNYHPKMCKKNLRVIINECSSLIHFTKMFLTVINNGEPFEVNVRKDNLHKFSQMMKWCFLNIEKHRSEEYKKKQSKILNSALLKPGLPLEVEDLEVGDVVFCICPTPGTVFRYFLITIHKLKGNNHAKKH